MSEISIASFVPGGIRATDYLHRKTFDETCSRCRKEIPEWDVPLMLWLPPDNEDMYVFCNACNALEPKGPDLQELDDERPW